jgi:hypothetical protein
MNLFSSNQAKSSKSRSSSSVTISNPSIAGRERLKHAVDGINAAHAAIEDLQERILRFESIITDSQRASAALHIEINNDGGKSLSAFSAGEVKPDDPIVAIVALAKSTREAAIAAEEILPSTRAALENARSQLTGLELNRAIELNKVVASYIDIDAQKYLKTFLALARLHDQMVGASMVQESNLLPGEPIHVRLTHEPLVAPRFISGAMGVSEGPQLHHNVSQRTADQSASLWAEVRSRLAVDADADVSDLITKERN